MRNFCSVIKRLCSNIVSILILKLNSIQFRRSDSKYSAANESTTKRRLFIDVSIISKHDAGTGIQRVVRGLGFHLLNFHPSHWDVITISSDKKCQYKQISYNFINRECINIDSGKITFREGDVFLGLDLSLDLICRYKRQLLKLKKVGGQVWFFIHDFLPIQNEKWFTVLMVKRFKNWVNAIAFLGDGFICNSSHTEADLHVILANYRTQDSYKSFVIPMGWDFDFSLNCNGLTAGFSSFIDGFSHSTTIIMVGTLEPRKGHKDIVTAFDLLWKQKNNCNLVLVGRPGWKTEQLAELINSHPENGKQLFWLDNASDEILKYLYKRCDGVIVASHAEGFGLPLIEALGFGKPVFARRIPAFERMLDENITYFHADSDTCYLAIQISEWLRKLESQPSIQKYAKRHSWACAAEFVWSKLS